MPHVTSYRRADGTPVRSHYRRPPGGGHSGAVGGAGGVGAVVAVLLVLAGLHAVTGGADTSLAATTTVSDDSQRLGGHSRIVQVASDRDCASARASAGRLRKRGIRAGVLRSGDYAPLRSGYCVVYVGPYPRTRAGQRAAEAVSAHLSGSKVRDVRAR